MTEQSLSACLHLVSRASAKAAGLKRYFTGKPCKVGHLSERAVCGCNCMECLYEYRRLPEVAQKARERLKDPALKHRMAEHSREYHRKNRDEILVKMKKRNAAYYAANKDRIKIQVGQYQAENVEVRREYKARWFRESMRSNPNFAAAVAMRKLITRTCERIKVRRKELGGTIRALGYTAEEFRLHIERQFLRGMSWGNRSEWHIDHIIPLAAFDLSSEAERKAANALTNLRPVWAAENMRKSDTIISLL